MITKVKLRSFHELKVYSWTNLSSLIVRLRFGAQNKSENMSPRYSVVKTVESEKQQVEEEKCQR